MAAKGGDAGVLDAAQKILDSFGTSKNAVTKGVAATLSKIDNRLSSVTDIFPVPSIEERLAAVEEIVLGWVSNRKLDDPSGEYHEYLAAVDEILNLMEDFPVSPSNECDGISNRFESALQLTMSKLEDIFRRILEQNTVPLEPMRNLGSVLSYSYSFASNDGSTDESSGPCEDEGGSSITEGGLSLRDSAVNLINPEVIDDLRDIAEKMIKAGYEKECCRVYSNARRDAYDEYLMVLGVEKLGIEEVQKITWSSMDVKMEKWIRAAKLVIRVMLSLEKSLCVQIFAGSELITDVFLWEITKVCMMQLVTFAEAIVVGQRSPEKLFRIIDMHDTIEDFLPDLQALFSHDLTKFVCEDVQGIQASLAEAAKAAHVQFEKKVHSDTSHKPMQGGDIAPLTQYVMNYVRSLVDKSDSLNVLLQVDVAGSNGAQVETNDDDDKNGSQLGDGSPLSKRLLLLFSDLEAKIQEQSKFYVDKGLQSVFLMNNILYIVQKVKGSELRKYVGDMWVRKRRGLIRQYSTAYLRASWSKVLSCLKDEGICGSGNSSNVSKMALKERFKNFNSCFEELYKAQTAWKVPDPQLREELRISISEKVLPAYRSFLGRFRSHIESGRHPAKYIKYGTEDLEKYLLDLFEGNSCVMHHPRKSR